ncbi:conserved hypothetical protein [Culex quinquefasciatus]|uniref:Uncharacterized protein n=1 Tax=Culex quinquefasciatus TaxID=7176 RepID=B0WK49_CULQU|nr:conserved hypothetical protein [Culex quinquefasciatus]|eukprot:XP_001849083.1 conserved hypothetical protein [Culex quinquefasciatus]
MLPPYVPKGLWTIWNNSTGHNMIADSGLMELNARVRKINRTTAALSGNFVQNVDMDTNFNGLIELHHSPLGNNQFNRYPMKLGPINLCAFLDTHWSDYYKYIVIYIPNVPKQGECPMTARTYPINDWIMDAEMFPPYVPTGLWKMIWTVWDNSTGHNLIMEIIFKVYDDGYF